MLNSDAGDPVLLAIQTVDWIQIRSVTNVTLLQPLQTTLDIGEAEAIALALELNAFIANGFWIRDELYAETLRLAGE